MTTRIQYLRDPKNHARVMTLVSRVSADDAHVEFAFSINRPDEWKGHNWCTTRTYKEAGLVKGDRFRKDLGRKIATSRLNSEDNVLVATLEGRKPTVAILETLRDASENSIVRRICMYELCCISAASKIQTLRDLNQQLQLAAE